MKKDQNMFLMTGICWRIRHIDTDQRPAEYEQDPTWLKFAERTFQRFPKLGQVLVTRNQMGLLKLLQTVV